MRTYKFRIILTCIIFLFTCGLGVQAQPWKGGLRLGKRAALHLRPAVERLVHRQATPRPVYMRVLPTPARLNQSVSFPLASHPREMYRGLALDAYGKELRSILKNGMKVTESHFPIWHGSYDGRPLPEDTPALFATTDPLLASTYAQMNRFRADKGMFLPVVLHLKRVGKDIALDYERTIEIPHDIPASWIYKVSALLSIDGKPRWGELKLAGDDGFLFIPYSLPDKPLKFQP